MKRIALFVVSAFFLANIYGCFALLAGAVGGAGTAVWLSGKLTQQVNAPYDRVIEAARSALRSLNLELTKESKTDKVAQLRSKYTDGREVWIDIRKVTEAASKIEVRVGAVSDKAAAEKILKKITDYL